MAREPDETQTRPWFESYGRVSKKLRYPPITLFDILKKNAVRFPKKPAIKSFGRVTNYGGLLRMVEAFRDGLQKLSVNYGDRVVILLPNCLERVISEYALLSFGAISVPINPLLPRSEFLKIMEDAGPVLIITLEDFASFLDDISENIIVITVDLARYASLLFGAALFLRSLFKRAPKLKVQNFSFHKILTSQFTPKGSEKSETLPRVLPSDIATIIYTSGTTGAPKGVALAHQNIVANVIQCRAWLPEMRRAKEVFLSALPFFHSYGLTVCMHLPILICGCNILIPRFTAKKAKSILKTVRRHAVSIFPVIPPMVSVFIEHKKALAAIGGVGGAVRFMPCGSSPLDPEKEKIFKDISTIQIRQGYGLTEASPVTHLMPMAQNKPESFGVPLPDTDVKIVDPESPEKTLDSGKIGELLIRGPQVMAGYWNKPEETQEVIKNGWLHTGDLAYMDEEGFFFYVDRKDDLIKVGGEKVYPSEVEHCLLQHPGISEAAVVGDPDPYRGFIVKAYVVLKNDCYLLIDQDLINFCQNRLARFKVPRIIEFVDELPKNLFKKVIRKKLRRP